MIFCCRDARPYVSTHENAPIIRDENELILPIQITIPIDEPELLSNSGYFLSDISFISAEIPHINTFTYFPAISLASLIIFTFSLLCFAI